MSTDPQTVSTGETRPSGAPAEEFGQAWNRFWFAPLDPYVLCLLRIGAGFFALFYLLSWTVDLIRWFGPDGLLSRSTVGLLTGASQGPVFHPSFFYWSNEPAVLWTIHGMSILVVVLFAVGLFTRVTAVLSLAAVLSYVHRGPMLTGTFEPVLTMFLLYLCLAPCGAYLSIDAWRRARKGQAPAGPAGEPPRYVSARISQRLVQVHLAALYAMMALNQLGGDVWWSGNSRSISAVKCSPAVGAAIAPSRAAYTVW